MARVGTALNNILTSRALALVSVLLLIGQARAQNSDECYRFAPTPEEFVEIPRQAEQMFVGRVVAFRMNDTSLATETPSCQRWGAPGESEVCRDFWSSVVSVQYVVEVPIKGIAANQTFESVIVNTDKPCVGLAIGQLWLLMGRWSDGIQLADITSAAVIENLRKRAGE